MRYSDIVAGMLGQGVAYSGDSDDLDLVLGEDDDELEDLLMGDDEDLLDELFAGDDDEDEDDIIAGLYDIIAGRSGRRRKKKRKGRKKSRARAIKQILQRRLAEKGAVVRQTGPTKAREWQLNFDSETPVPGGATRTIIRQPQVIFRGERLIVPSDIAGQFLIVDIIVGQRSQFAATGSAPARTYQENAVGSRLALDTAQISQNLVLRVENIGSTDQRFVASMIGTIVD